MCFFVSKCDLSDPLFLSVFPNSLKTTLQKKLSSDSVDLSGIPLSTRDVRQVAFYLQNNRDSVVAVDISFTELQDENLRLLLPLLASLLKLSTLALNGNRLTLAILKDLSEMLKDPKKFSSLSWIDLGNNVDIFTMPQPLLVALRRRCSLKSSLPTIYEYTGGSTLLLPSGNLHRGAQPLRRGRGGWWRGGGRGWHGEQIRAGAVGFGGEAALQRLHPPLLWEVMGCFLCEALTTVEDTSSRSTP